MRKKFFYSFIIPALILGVTGSCSKKKGGGGTPPPPTEQNLVVTTDPANGSVQAAAPLINFSLSVTINSTMPPQGVTIDVSAKKDDGSGDPAFYSTSISSSAAANNFTITNTPLGTVCVCTVTVTSKSKSTNTWTGSYRYSRK